MESSSDEFAILNSNSRPFNCMDCFPASKSTLEVVFQYCLGKGMFICVFLVLIKASNREEPERGK